VHYRVCLGAILLWGLILKLTSGKISEMVILYLFVALCAEFLCPSFAFPQAASFAPIISPKPWHAGGFAYWNTIKDIVPKSYEVQRVKPDKPVLFDNGDIFSDCWQHAPWTEPFVDIEGPEKYGPTR
jgi:hypothetical protein